MHVEKRSELARNVAAGHRAVQRFELALHFADRQLKALDFGGYLLRGDRVVRDFERRMRDELCATDRDAGRDADAMKREADHQRVSASMIRSRSANGIERSCAMR